MDFTIANEFETLPHEIENNLCLYNSFIKIPGEEVKYKNKDDEINIEITNYRLFYSNDNNQTHFDLPLGRIESIEIKDGTALQLLCKDGQNQRCELETPEVCQTIHKELHQILSDLPNSPPFAFEFLSKCYEDQEQYREYLAHLKPLSSGWSVEEEFERMKFDNKIWGISNCNQNYKLCNSYPQKLILPAGHCTETDLEPVAIFRHSHRIPTVVWRHQLTGTVIARCSQPSVSWYGARSNEDEELVQAIRDASLMNSGGNATRHPQEECISIKSEASDDPEPNSYRDSRAEVPLPSCQKLLIVDARAYTAAVANRARGGGCEYEDYYTNCEIQFMNMPNIHKVRHSFTNLRYMFTSDQSRWLSLLENTNWMHNLAVILKTAMVIVDAVEIERRPAVLVHCSDGWDRTPQIVSLAEICLDPYYRTKKGFQVLVEKEWLDFGHKFADRCGLYEGTSDTNERSPVFLQFLDCVFQLQKQFPCHFEFNSHYLESLAHHVLSGLFGNFFCNSAMQRQKVQDVSFCIWSYLHSAPRDFYSNFLYEKKDEIIRPSYQIKDLEFWKEMYYPSLESTTKMEEFSILTSAMSILARKNSHLVTASTDTITEELLPPPPPEVNCIKSSVSVSTSTTDLNKCGEKEDPPTSYTTLTCSSAPCINGSETSETSTYPSAYSTPHHSRTPSSGFPASPSDERPLPPPWQALKGTSTKSSKVQHRIHQIIVEYEATLEKERSCKRCGNCRNKTTRASYQPSMNLEAGYSMTDTDFEFIYKEECRAYNLCRKCGVMYGKELVEGPLSRCKEQANSSSKHVTTAKPPVVSTGTT